MILYLLKWPNGEHRVLDAATLMASDWLFTPPEEALSTVPLPHDVGVTNGSLRHFANDAFDIASRAPKDEVDRWLPPGFELVRAEGRGAALAAVTAALAATADSRAATIARNLRRLTHMDD